jgi:hypothetical protein
MYKDHNVDGAVYTDGKICCYYMVKNGDCRRIATKTIHLQNQFKNGGQSQNRLARNRDIQREQYITGLAEKAVDVFYDKTNNCSKVLNLIFCGPAQFKIEMSEHKLIRSFFNKTYLHIINMAEFDQKKLIQYIDQLADPNEAKHLADIQHMIAMADERLAFGDEIDQLIKLCQLKKLYINKDHPYLSTLDQIGYDIEVVLIQSNSIDCYGGMIGCRFY